MARKDTQGALQDAQEAYEAARVAYGAASDRYADNPTSANKGIVTKASNNLAACYMRLSELRQDTST